MYQCAHPIFNYKLFVGVIFQYIFSGKCKADGACDKTTGKCLDDTGCANGKLEFVSVSWKVFPEM